MTFKTTVQTTGEQDPGLAEEHFTEVGMQINNMRISLRFPKNKKKTFPEPKSRDDDRNFQHDPVSSCFFHDTSAFECYYYQKKAAPTPRSAASPKKKASSASHEDSNLAVVDDKDWEWRPSPGHSPRLPARACPQETYLKPCQYGPLTLDHQTDEAFGDFPATQSSSRRFAGIKRGNQTNSGLNLALNYCDRSESLTSSDKSSSSPAPPPIPPRSPICVGGSAPGPALPPYPSSTVLRSNAFRSRSRAREYVLV